MKNLIQNTTDFALSIIESYVNDNSIAIDATCGNGHDTLALVKMGAYKVYSFDIQESAITSARELLTNYEEECSSKSNTKVDFILDSHSNLDKYVSHADIVLFNLGYLPKGNKEITTVADTTLVALKKSLEVLKINGICSLVMYSGHENGKFEKEEILNFASGLNSSKYHCSYISMINQINNPPEILLITKKF